MFDKDFTENIFLQLFLILITFISIFGFITGICLIVYFRHRYCKMKRIEKIYRDNESFNTGVAPVYFKRYASKFDLKNRSHI